MIINKIKNSKGFMSLDALLAMSAVLMVMILAIGFFTYMMPKQAIEQEVNLLGRLAKLNGGLTTADVNAFKDRMVERGYKKEQVTVTLITKDVSDNLKTVKRNNKTVNPLNISCKANVSCPATALYVPREAQAIMEIRAEMPANKKGLLGAFGFFKISDGAVSDTYVFKERVMSERH